MSKYIKLEDAKERTNQLFHGDEIEAWLESLPTIEVNEDCISRQDAIDELEYEAEMLNRVLDDMYVVGQEREKFAWGLGLVECFIEDIKELPSVVPSRAEREEKHPCALCKYHYDEGDLMVCMRCPAEPRKESDDE